MAVLSEEDSFLMLKKVTNQLDELEKEQTHIYKKEMYLLLNAVTDTVFVSNKAGIIRFANPSVYRLLHYYPEDILGRNICEILACEDIENHLDETIATKAKSKEGFPIPVTVFVGHMTEDGMDLVVSIVRKS